MQVPRELEPALVNILVTSLLTGVNIAMIVYQVFNHQYGKGKHMLNLHLFQLCLSLAKNIHMVLLSGFTMFDCQSLAMSEFFIYFLWVPAMESVLFLRARTFSEYPRITTAIVGVLWVIRVAMGMYASSTVVALSPPGSICVFSSDWSIGDYTFICLFLSETTMFVAFAHRTLVIVRDTSGVLQQRHSAKYTSLLRHGFVASLVLIASFAIQSQLVKLPVFAPYTLSLFIAQNMVATTIVAFVLDDTRNLYRKPGGSSRNHLGACAKDTAALHSESGSGHGGAPGSTHGHHPLMLHSSASAAGNHQGHHPVQADGNAMNHFDHHGPSASPSHVVNVSPD